MYGASHMVADDAELLRRYARERSHEAFNELARRHLALVYHSALRQLGDERAAAEDVSQQVFIRLAQRAESLQHHRSLAGWLHTTTRFVASETRRTEWRRRNREQHALMRADETASPSTGSATESSPTLRPLLDAALGELRAADREALLLRFFSGLSFQELGDRIGTSENAARMRVERALERLRRRLAHRRVTSTAAALALALGTEAAAAIPPHLFSAVTAAALATAIAPGSGLLATLKVIYSMSSGKIALTTAAVLLAGGGVLTWQQREANRELRAENTALRGNIVSLKSLTDENESLRREQANTLEQEHRDQAELGRVRGELAAHQKAAAAYLAHQRAGTNTTNPAAAANKLSPGMVPVEVMSNAGRDAPSSAAQTLLWATQRGDIDLAASLLTFNPADRSKMEAFIASLPPEVRAQYDTPEKMMAFVISGSPRPLAGVQLVDQTQPDPDSVVQHVKIQYQNGETVSEEINFHRAADGWQQVVSPTMVDRAIAYFKARS